MAASTSSWAVVGCCVMILSPNAGPIRMDAGCRETKVRAAALAASRRVGERSVAAMLVETSKARMTVPSRRGSAMVASGRASETSSRVSAPRRSAGPAWRPRLLLVPPVATMPSAASCSWRTACQRGSRR